MIIYQEVIKRSHHHPMAVIVGHLLKGFASISVGWGGSQFPPSRRRFRRPWFTSSSSNIHWILWFFVSVSSLLIQSNLVIRNFLVTAKLFLNPITPGLSEGCNKKNQLLFCNQSFDLLYQSMISLVPKGFHIMRRSWIFLDWQRSLFNSRFMV